MSRERAMSYETHLLQHSRLAVLRHLAAAPAHSANDRLLHDVLQALGLAVSHDQLAGILDWLAEQDVVRLDTIAGVAVVRITRRGLDVAEGRARVPGIKPPPAVP
jgi:hypothetical protein